MQVSEREKQRELKLARRGGWNESRVNRSVQGNQSRKLPKTWASIAPVAPLAPLAPLALLALLASLTPLAPLAPADERECD